MLSAYMSSLHESNFVMRLHQKLHLHQQLQYVPTNASVSKSRKLSGGGGGGGGSAASDLKTYYAARPGLRKYTLGVELDRMDYTLVLSNGKVVRDKDVVRSYFGVNNDGGTIEGNGGGAGAGREDDNGTSITTEELLIRSANQSLLADLLVALTGAEEDILTANDKICGGYDNGDGFFSEDEFPNQDADRESHPSTVLILSGPTLCMTSVAESCQFKVDLQSGFVEAVCSLAISVPYHENNNSGVAPASSADDDTITIPIANGRLVLARATVSVRFRPGGEGGDSNDEPTVQYAVRSVSPSSRPSRAYFRMLPYRWHTTRTIPSSITSTRMSIPTVGLPMHAIFSC